MRLIQVSVVLFVILLFADNYDAKTSESEREPQVISSSHKKNRPASKSGLKDKYQPTWESLDARPLPQWYDDAKVGENSSNNFELI